MDKKRESKYRFQVNLGGMIEILSDHLYSGPEVFIRELLQNGIDAISARKRKEKDFEGKIHIFVKKGKKIVFTDNGSGLTKGEVHQFLSIIGESSKKEVINGTWQNDYIGRFGIGLLSCFMVSDEIKVRTCSMDDKSGKTIEWIGKPDGTYTLEIKNKLMDIGTSIILKPKEGMGDYFTRKSIEKLVLYYGMLLPVPIILESKKEIKQINPVEHLWKQEGIKKEEIIRFGEQVFGEKNFLDCFFIESEEGGIDGVAYVLPYAFLSAGQQRHRIYLKNMFLTETGEDILPQWAGFLRCIINTEKLRPTASRECFYRDAMLAEVKEKIEKQILQYILDLAESDSMIFQQFLSVNQMTLRALAAENEALCSCIVDFFTFKTTRGDLTGRELRTGGNPFVCAYTVEDYKRISQLYMAQHKLLIAAYHAYDEELLSYLANKADMPIEAVSDWSLEELMEDVPKIVKDKSCDFLEMADCILKPYQCRSALRSFYPTTMPVFYNMCEAAEFHMRIKEVKEEAEDMFQEMLAAFEKESMEYMDHILYFNYENPLVKKMLISTGKELEYFVEILYLQALMAGGVSLRGEEMYRLNEDILLLMEGVLS